MKQALLYALLAQVPLTLGNDDYLRPPVPGELVEVTVSDTQGAAPFLVEDQTNVRIDCSSGSTAYAIFCFTHAPSADLTLQQGANAGIVDDAESADPGTGPASSRGRCFVMAPGRVVDHIAHTRSINSSRGGYRQGHCLNPRGLGCNEAADCATGPCRLENSRFRRMQVVHRIVTTGQTATCYVETKL